MWEVRRAQLGAAVVAVPPFSFLAFLFGLDMIAIVHELGGEWGPSGIAQGVAADPVRWQWSYLLAAAGTAVRLISVLAICSYLRTAGEHLWSFLAVPLLTLSHGAFIFTWGFSSMVAPASEAGASVEAIFEVLMPGSGGDSLGPPTGP